MKSIIIIILCFSSVFCTAQKDSVNYSHEKIAVHIYMAMGAESGLALPKLGMSYKFYKRNRFESTIGIDGSAWILFTFFMSGNIYNTVEWEILKSRKKQRYTSRILVENSLGVFHHPELDFGTGNSVGPFTHLVYTPKIGLRFHIIQVKLGNSFF